MRIQLVRYLVLSGLALSAVPSVAAPVPMGDSGKSVTRVSVLRFDQEVDHILEGCRGWSWTTQNQLQTELERALSSEGLVVLERRDINRMYDREHDLVNADRREAPKRGKFKTAQFTITGGITELGLCDDSNRESVSLGGLISLVGGPPNVDLDLGRSKTTTTVKLVAQVVSVETGEVLRSFEARSQIEDQGLAVGVGVAGIGGSKSTRTRPPVERASNQAIADLARQMAGYLKAGV